MNNAGHICACDPFTAMPHMVVATGTGAARHRAASGAAAPVGHGGAEAAEAAEAVKAAEAVGTALDAVDAVDAEA